MLGQAIEVPDSRADGVLRLVELGGAARRRVKGYSLGMRQRLGLAVALLGDPELLILDEPANGLDPEGVRWLRGFLRGLASEGRTVLISSHVLAEVAQTVDRVLIISRGRLVLSASLAELAARESGAGIGWITGFRLAAEIGDINRFFSPVKRTGYTGLCPRVNRSGEVDYRGPLSKHVARYLRRGLTKAAIRASPHPPNG
jgi:ABC-type multidrug transport system ATPase subunit